MQLGLELEYGKGKAYCNDEAPKQPGVHFRSCSILIFRSDLMSCISFIFFITGCWRLSALKGLVDTHFITKLSITYVSECCIMCK